MLFYKLQEMIDTSEMKDEIGRNWELWDRNTKRQDTIMVQRETKSIYLRNHVEIKGLDNRENHNTKDNIVYEKFPVVKKFLDDFIQTYGGTLGCAMLVLLPLNKTVYPHIDGGSYYRARDRFHFVVFGEYVYVVEDSTRLFKEGELWFFDNQKMHFSQTVGQEDRISIIFDVEGSRWRDHI